MKSVLEIIKEHNPVVWSVQPSDTVFEAIKVLAEKSLGAVPVIEDNKLVGILSERDYTRKVALYNKNSKETLVRDIMTAGVLVVKPDTSSQECMALMSAKKIRHLPVVDGETVIGMISTLDLMNEMIAEQQSTIAQLESYIYGQ